MPRKNLEGLPVFRGIQRFERRLVVISNADGAELRGHEPAGERPRKGEACSPARDLMGRVVQLCVFGHCDQAVHSHWQFYLFARTSPQASARVKLQPAVQPAT